MLIAPARLASFRGIESLDHVTPPSGNFALALVWSLGRTFLERVTLPYLCRLPRVRRAWTARYLAGQARLSDLGKPSRESFLVHPEFLDCWISSRLPQAQRALAGFSLYSDRRFYVECPLAVGDRTNGPLIERPSSQTLKEVFARRRAVVAIVGQGGSGKSTLACAIARWAMGEDRAQRLAEHAILPVFIVQETTDLLATVKGVLREMLNEEELPEDLVRGLLSRKRLLVIIDGLSERETKTQMHISQIFSHENSPFNELLITSRSEPQLGVTEKTILKTILLDARGVVPFIIDYLARLGKVEALQDGRLQLQLGEQILSIAESRDRRTTGVTPLLIKLFVDSAVKRASEGSSLDDMPQAIPEVFVDYLQRLNAGPAYDGRGFSNDVFIAAAQVLAELAVGSNLVPSDFSPSEAHEALKRQNLGDFALIDRLVSSTVLEQRRIGGIPILRFGLDPVAENLAAIRAVLSLRATNAAAAQRLLVTILGAPGYPGECEGYLRAFASCYRAYQRDVGLPELSFPWEEREELGESDAR